MGHKLTPEQKARQGAAISAAKTGKPRPDMAGDGNPMRRPDVAEKIGAWHRGRPKSPEQRAKIAETLRGRKLPPEHRAKLRKKVPGYKGAHFRVRQERGKASEHSCVDCDNPARDWALKPGCIATITDEYARTYSLDANDYEPMCHPCHMLRDETPFARRKS